MIGQATKIEELNSQLANIGGKGDGEALKKMKFDNSLLMKKLTQYKTAEKSIKELVTDCEKNKAELEEITVKYFNKLTEDEK